MFAHDDRAAASNIRDVARKAGVSPSTVSRVLRGSTKVLPATRDHVLRAAAELGYVPSPAASRLASGRTRTVGLIVPFGTRWFFSEVIGGAESVLAAAGYDLLLYIVSDADGRRRFFEAMPLRRRVDGVLAVSAAFRSDELDRLAELRVPIVGIGGRLGGVPRVGIDDEAGAAMAVGHLIALGHRDIAMICGDPDDPVGRSYDIGPASWVRTRARRRRYRVGCRTGWSPSRGASIGGGLCMERLLAGRRLPTAVFAESDEMAFGALQTLRKAGLEVPRDVSVVGFDDHEMAAPADLTTVAQPVVRQGELAAQLLLDTLAGTAVESNDIDLPVRLVVRGSTARPRQRVPAVDVPAGLSAPGRPAPRGAPLSERWIWDFWFAPDARRGPRLLPAGAAVAGLTRGPGTATRPVGHAVSTDLRRWTVLPDALGRGPAGSFDDLATWTGSVLRARRPLADVLHRSVHCRRRHGAARSGWPSRTTWCAGGGWTAAPLAADPRWYEKPGPPAEEAWRDPWVFADDDVPGCSTC